MMMEHTFKTLPTEKLLPIIREALDCGGKFTLTVTGNSMAPTLHHLRDRVELVSEKEKTIRRGDIVLFQRSSGECILHRVKRVKGEHLQLNGDAQVWTEWIARTQVVGIVTRICRSNRWFNCDSRKYRAYVFLWQQMRIVRKILFYLRSKMS